MVEMTSTINDKIKIKLSHCTSPFELYQAIELIYTNKTSFQVTALHMRLSSFKFNSTDFISEGISELQNIVSKLKNLGERVSDHMIEGIVLAALPLSFRTFVTVWKGIGESERTLSNLFNRILAEIEDNKLFHVREDKALLTRGRRTGNKRQSDFAKNKAPVKPNSSNQKYGQPSKQNGDYTNSQSKPKRTCHYCKKPGHWIKERRKLEAKRKQEGHFQGRNKGNRDSPRQIALMTRENKTTKWIDDSGASRHMTSDTEVFIEYFNEPKSIYLADDKAVEALGLGQIVTSTGTLNNVFLVPAIPYNLFSVPAATNHGISVLVDGDSIQLFKDGDKVLHGKRNNDTYELELEVRTEARVLKASTMKEWHLVTFHPESLKIWPRIRLLMVWQ